MNKRQCKKAYKKVVYPLVDEMNLLTLSEEEYKKAIKDFNEYVFKYCKYKHYKDKNKVFCKRTACGYHFPVGEATKTLMESILMTARRYKPSTINVTQTLSESQKAYIDVN